MSNGHAQGCIFCKIANGEIASHAVFESDTVFAFPDRGAIRPGHIQIVPKQHFEYFDDLPPEVLNEITSVGQRIARAVKTLYNAERSAFLFTGGDIPHAHAHVLPMIEKTDITSRRYIAEEELTFRSLPQLSESELQKTAAAVKGAMDC